MTTGNNVAAQAGDEPMPCPFCGGAPVIDGKDEYVRIRCEGCGVAGQARYFSSDSEEAIEWAEVDAIKLWNHRVSPRATADVERDAARYRWLRDPTSSRWASGYVKAFHDEALDKVIDDETFALSGLATTKPGA